MHREGPIHIHIHTYGVCVTYIFFPIYLFRNCQLKTSGNKPKKRINCLVALTFGVFPYLWENFRSKKKKKKESCREFPLLNAYDCKTDFTGSILSLVSRKAVEKAVKWTLFSRFHNVLLPPGHFQTPLSVHMVMQVSANKWMHFPSWKKTVCVCLCVFNKICKWDLKHRSM